MIQGKRFLSLILASTILVSATSCSILQKKVDPQEIIDAAESFAKSVSSLDSKKILKKVEGMDDDDADEFKKRLSMNDMDSNEHELKLAIADTIEFKIDEDSVEIEKDTAYCDVEFTIVDYVDATSNKAGTSSYFIDAIKSCQKTVAYSVQLEFIKSKDIWLITATCLDNLNDLYSFIDYKFNFDSYFVNVNALRYISEEDFFIALESIGIQKSDTDCMYDTSFSFNDDDTDFEVKYCIDAYADNENYFSYARCADEATAKALFHYYFDDYVYLFDSKDFSGIKSYELGDNTGYLLIDGIYDDTVSGTYTPYHDAIFLKGDTVIFVMASDYDSAIEQEVDAFLDALEYPHP